MEKQMERFRLSKTAEEISSILNSFDDKEDKLKREIINIENNQLDLEFDYLFESNKDYIIEGGTVKSIKFKNLIEANGELAEDYWIRIVFKRNTEVVDLDEIVVNSGIKILNPTLDITETKVVHLLITHDGFNLCCIGGAY